QFAPEDETEKLYEELMAECETPEAAESEYIRNVFCGARDYRETALEKIRSHAQGWKVERFSKTTLTILQLAIYEMEKREDVPVKIAINEAVELSKRFDEDGSRKFVNGILGSVAAAE
ncbi:MAG: transcription antitermination factor NusB, partial [Clostridia bacterium]|nr:transcription antitermination factor NusB [Clostridia bacterium]